MEGLFRFYKGIHVRVSESGESNKDIGVSEIRSRPGEISNTLRTSSFHNANIGDWLGGVSSSVPEDGSDYTRVALVWVNARQDCTPWRLDMPQRSLELVVEKFRIEDMYRYCHSSLAGMAAFPTSNWENKETRSYCLFMSDIFELSWSHNSTRGTSRGVCLADSRIISTFQSLLEYQLPMASHPMFLAAIAGLMLENYLDTQQRIHGKIIRSVENRTGYHGWKTSSIGAAEGDYVSLSARMSGSGVALAGLKRTAKLLHESIGFIHQCSLQKGSGMASTNSQHQDPEITMQECLIVLRNRLTIDEIDIEFLLHRTQIQTTAVS